QRAERRDPLALREERSEALRAEPRERVLDPDGGAPALDVLGRVRAGRFAHVASPLWIQEYGVWILIGGEDGFKGLFPPISDPKPRVLGAPSRLRVLWRPSRRRATTLHGGWRTRASGARSRRTRCSGRRRSPSGSTS